MTHPKVDSYSVLEVKTKRGKEYEIFVGEIDGELHLLGYRPSDIAYLFSENECSSLDLGIVRLPENKKSLSDLVKGDILSVEKEGKVGELNGIIYLGRG